jgi:hypothetical protein
MIQMLTRAGRWARLRAPLLALAVLAGACDSADKLATTEPTVPVEGAALDSAATDVASTDTVPADTAGGLTDVDLAGIEGAEASALVGGVPYGPYGLWRESTYLKSFNAPFRSSLNYTDPNRIINQISIARNKGQRLILAMTGGGYDAYRTNGKFDMYKWKRRMNLFNRSDIKAAIAQGVRDGVVTMNNIMDEPNVKAWGGVMTKPKLDEMARYVKNIFPSLPVAVAVIHTWRTHERYRNVDVIIPQYSWYMGSISTWKNAAISQARLNGTSIAFSLNLLNGGIQNWSTGKCPSTTTGGYGTRYPACRMTATQVREWSKILGAGSCSMIMWRYDDLFMSKSANQTAFKEAASYLRSASKRSCRRGAL